MKYAIHLPISEAFASESDQFHQDMAEHAANREGVQPSGPVTWQIVHRASVNGEPIPPLVDGEHTGPMFVVEYEAEPQGSAT